MDIADTADILFSRLYRVHARQGRVRRVQAKRHKLRIGVGQEQIDLFFFINGRVGMRVEAGVWGYLLALVFAVLTGTLFGFYPAWKASRLVPIEAMNLE